MPSEADPSATEESRLTARAERPPGDTVKCAGQSTQAGLVHLKVEDVTAEWLSSLLGANYPGVRVITAEHVDLGWGASGKLRVRLAYNEAGIKAGLPESMIVKGGFGRQPGMSHMYGIEVASYAHVVPALDVCAPACYFAGAEPKAGDPVLLLEDLRTHKVRFNSALNPMSFEQAKQHVEAMARFHASLWGSPELMPGGRLAFMDEIVADASIARLAREENADVWSRYLNLPRGAALPKSIVDPERLFPALRRLWALNRESTYCAIHNDCHIGNTYVYPDGRVGFLDWAAKRAPWYKDLAYFIVTALEIDRRREWERDLIRAYLDAVGRRVTAPTFEEAWRLYRCEPVYSLVVWTCNGDERGQFQSESVNTACAVRAGMAVLDLGSLEMLP